MSSRLRWTPLSSCLLLLAACAPARTAPTGEALPRAEFRFVEAAMEPTDTLSVSVHGSADVRTPGAASYGATVRNGSTTTTRYYYWWFIAACAKRTGCAPTSYQALAQGEGRDTVTVSFSTMSAETDLVVQVAEIDGRGRTGSSTEFIVEGPRRTLGGGQDGFAGGSCDWYAGNFYPHTGIYTDARTMRKWKRHFRRDYCGNRVSWSPGH